MNVENYKPNLYERWKRKKDNTLYTVVGLPLLIPELKRKDGILLASVSDRELVCLTSSKLIELFEKLKDD
jgi:hypothetical protein